ncbi:MAG: H-NS histone family protein [Betaproteobacteria bacterium]|nr:H-NS histone family protein [Betaproteobacteria bacterium]
MPRMTYENIQKQIERLQAQAKKLESTHIAKKTKAIVQVRALMKKLEVNIEDLHTANRKSTETKKPQKASKKPLSHKPRVPVEAKYRDPGTGDSWTGRGKPPRWLAAHMAEGRSRDEFLIKAPGVSQSNAANSHEADAIANPLN